LATIPVIGRLPDRISSPVGASRRRGRSERRRLRRGSRRYAQEQTSASRPAPSCRTWRHRANRIRTSCQEQPPNRGETPITPSVLHRKITGTMLLLAEYFLEPTQNARYRRPCPVATRSYSASSAWSSTDSEAFGRQTPLGDTPYCALNVRLK